MSEKMTPERVLHKLLACGQKEEMKAVLALIAERDQLEAMVDGFWWYLDQAYNIESREELEVIAEGWEPSNPMQVAIHHIWKREPKVVELDAKLAAAERERDQLREDLRIERLRAQEELCAESERLAYSRCETEDVAAYAAAKLAAAEERMAAMEGALKTIGDLMEGSARDGKPWRYAWRVKELVVLDGTTTSQKGEDHE